MDRNSQPPQYPRDRPLIQNPNHQAPPPGPPYSYATPTTQAPVHVPFTDPYTHNRDPFLPTASQHQRRESYGIHGAGASLLNGPQDRAQPDGHWSNSGSQPHHHSHQQAAGPPPPPPPPSSGPHHQSNLPTYTPDHTRQRSMGGSPPAGYYPNSRDSLPQPPSSRNMPPPSPQKQNGSNSYSNQQQRSSDAYNHNRELPGLGSTNRPGSALSISSLLGDSSASRAQPQNSPPTTQTAPSPITRTMQPPSPRGAQITGPRNDYGSYERPRTPDRFPPPPQSRQTHLPQYGPSSPPQSQLGADGSPQRSRQGPTPAGSYKPTTLSEQRYYPNPPSRDNSHSTHAGSSIPPRPNSQPSHGIPLAQEQERRALYEQQGHRRPPYGYAQDDRRSDQPSARVGLAEVPEDGQRVAGDRERPVTVQPVTQSAYSPPKDRPRSHQQQQQSGFPGRNLFQRPPVEDGVKGHPREDALYNARNAFAPQQGSQPPVRHPPMNIDEMSRMPRPFEYPPRSGDPYHQPPPTSDPTSIDRRRVEQVSNSGASSVPPYQTRGSPFDLQHQRAYHLGPDANRRTGRASPLPQAVQGASLQPSGPAGNPEIKTEFGRLWGGLRSAPSRNGTATPSRQSPLPQNGGDPFSSAYHGDNGNVMMARMNSQSGRRSAKRVKDEDVLMIDDENDDGRSTPSMLRTMDNKRLKHHHSSEHHHHHHRARGHHHHVHRKGHADSEDPSTSNGGHFSTIRLGQSGTPAGELGHHHHHHHINHQPHVHLREKTKTPEKTYQVQSVLDYASQQPRRKLGTTIYEPKYTQPSSRVPLDDKYGFTMIPNPLPNRIIQGQVNCEYEVRIDRKYLRKKEREVVTRQGYLWGTDIYRDDSDPLAAAIHSGWILGAWDDVNDSNLEWFGKNCVGAKEPENVDEVVTSAPPSPFVPPEGLDLRLTLLILPPLEQYFGSRRNGIGSHKAAEGYRGMSFMIHRMQWTREGPGSRGQARTSAARSQRLSDAQLLIGLWQSQPANGMAHNGTAVTV